MKLSFKNGNFLKMFIVLSIYFVGTFVIPVLSGIVSILFFKNFSVKISIYLLILSNFLAFILIIYYVLRNKINNLEDSSKFSNKKAIFYGVVGFLVCMVLQLILGVVLSFLSKIYGFNPISENTEMINKIIKEVPIFIVIPIIYAPIIEELIFRKAIFGYFYDILRGSNKLLRFFIASIITGVLFALPHDGYSPFIIVYLLLSMVFSFLYIYTKNIITPIVSHFLMNLFSLLVQLFFNQ